MKKLDDIVIPITHLIGSSVLLLGSIGGGAYWYATTQTSALSQIRNSLAQATTTFEHNIAELAQKIAAAQEENALLHEQLSLERARNAEFGQRVDSLATTVNRLEKLSKTDRELLQKYSNVYFLSENFVPSPLSNIDPQYILKKDGAYQIHQEISPHLHRLLQDAEAGGAPLRILSAYRSFGKQADLKKSYKITYGSGTANQFSADQGYSEHQLGSTVDFTTAEGGENLDVFEKSAGFAWLQAHAHEYGFILSYPKGNKYFAYEPWHWRFVGRSLAIKLFNEKRSFYDLDQREINEYLVLIFD